MGTSSKEKNLHSTREPLGDKRQRHPCNGDVDKEDRERLKVKLSVGRTSVQRISLRLVGSR